MPGLNESVSLSRSYAKIKFSNNIVYTVVRSLVSHGTCIRNGVNGNTAINSRGERNRKRLRSTDLANGRNSKNTSDDCASARMIWLSFDKVLQQSGSAILAMRPVRHGPQGRCSQGAPNMKTGIQYSYSLDSILLTTQRKRAGH